MPDPVVKKESASCLYSVSIQLILNVIHVAEPIPGKL